MRYEYVNVIDFVAPYMSESPTQEQLTSFSKHLSLMHSSASMRDSEESQKQEFSAFLEKIFSLSLIHISEPTRPRPRSRMPSSA